MCPAFTFIAALKGGLLKCVTEPKLIEEYSLGGSALGDKGQSSSSIIKPQDGLLAEFSRDISGPSLASHVQLTKKGTRIWGCQ